MGFVPKAFARCGTFKVYLGFKFSDNLRSMQAAHCTRPRRPVGL
jgi:hypothetical protein